MNGLAFTPNLMNKLIAPKGGRCLNRTRLDCPALVFAWRMIGQINAGVAS